MDCSCKYFNQAQLLLGTCSNVDLENGHVHILNEISFFYFFFLNTNFISMAKQIICHPIIIELLYKVGDLLQIILYFVSQ